MSAQLSSVAIEEGSQTMFLADDSGVGSSVVAVDMRTSDVRWRYSAATLIAGVDSLATLPGVVIAASYGGSLLVVLSASDGAELCTVALKVWQGAGNPMHLAAFSGSVDSECGSVFVNVDNAVAEWRWDSTACALSHTRKFETLGAGHNFRPLAVMPPASGKHVAHLVVGECLSNELRVLSLPDCAIIHTHSLPFDIEAIAADPAGTTIVFSLRDGEVRVVDWPLPGMPELA